MVALLIGAAWGAVLVAVAAGLWWRKDRIVDLQPEPVPEVVVSWGMPEDYPTWEWPRDPGPVLVVTGPDGVDRVWKAEDQGGGLFRVTAPNGRSRVLRQVGPLVLREYPPLPWPDEPFVSESLPFEKPPVYESILRGPIS